MVGTALALGAGIASAVGGIASAVNAGNNRNSAAPQLAPVAQPLTSQDAQQALVGQGQTAANLAQGVQQAQSGLGQQQQFVNALNAQNGIANQSNVYNQLQGVANGTGPNPAQAMLDQSTGQNVAQQAALLAAQRGSSANIGLQGRQAAMAGGNIQQQAAGQAATMQANQQLGALNQLGGIAGQQVGQQQQGLSNLNQLSQAQQQAFLNQQNTQASNVLNQFQNQQSNMINAQNSVNSSNAGANQENIKNANNALGGAIGGLGAAAGALNVAKLAQGGMVEKPYKGDSHLARLSHEHISGKFKPMAGGGKVPGKPEVSGAKDTQKNDKVKALLSAGEIVLPRSVTMSKDPVKKSAEFVAAIMAKKGKK